MSRDQLAKKSHPLGRVPFTQWEQGGIFLALQCSTRVLPDTPCQVLMPHQQAKQQWPEKGIVARNEVPGHATRRASEITRDAVI